MAVPIVLYRSQTCLVKQHDLSKNQATDMIILKYVKGSNRRHQERRHTTIVISLL